MLENFLLTYFMNGLLSYLTEKIKADCHKFGLLIQELE